MNQIPAEARTTTLNGRLDLPNQALKQQVTINTPTATASGELVACIDKYSMEDVVELKISRFLDQIGSFYPEDLHELIMNKVEKPLISQILRRVGGNQVHASRILGINRNTLRKKIKIYGL